MNEIDAEFDDETGPLLDLLYHAKRDATALCLTEITALVEAAICALASPDDPPESA